MKREELENKMQEIYEKANGSDRLAIYMHAVELLSSEAIRMILDNYNRQGRP